MATIDKIVFSQNTPAKNTLWARPSEKGTELLIFNKGKWGTVGADDFQRFHYEVYSSLEDITEPKPNALYLIGPKGEGEDKYDEYVYTEEGFTKIGDTSIDMSDVIKYSKNSDDSYTLKAEGTEIKKLKTTDDSTIVLGNNNSIEFGASGTINMQSGKISGVKDIQMTFGKIDNVGTISGSSGGLDITASGTAGVNINGITIKSGGTLTFGDGTTMNTAATPTNLDDANNIIGGKKLKIYYGSGINDYYSPFSYRGKGVLTVGEIETSGALTCGGELTTSGIILDTNCSIVTYNSGIGIYTTGRIVDINGVKINSSGSISKGTIQSTTFESGNTFTTGFVDELKTALGIS